MTILPHCSLFRFSSTVSVGQVTWVNDQKIKQAFIRQSFSKQTFIRQSFSKQTFIKQSFSKKQYNNHWKISLKTIIFQMERKEKF